MELLQNFEDEMDDEAKTPDVKSNLPPNSKEDSSYDLFTNISCMRDMAC